MTMLNGDKGFSHKIISLSLAAAAVLFAVYSVISAQNDLKNDIMRIAHAASGAVRISSVESFSGSDDDLDNPRYKALKETFFAISSPCDI